MLDLSKGWLEVADDKGNVSRHDVLFSFNNEIDDNTYVVHTANETDENGKKVVYAFCFNEKTGSDKIMNVEDFSEIGTADGTEVIIVKKVRGFIDAGCFFGF